MSRLRSTRSAGAAAGASAARTAAARGPRVAVAVPKSDIFVVMLGIALGAIILGTLLMVGVLWRHGFSISVSSLRQVGPPAAVGHDSPGIPMIG